MQLATCIWQKCNWQNAIGKMQLAKCYWRNAIGKVQLAKCNWQNAIGKVQLAKCYWQNAIGKVQLLCCTLMLKWKFRGLLLVFVSSSNVGL